MNTTHRAFAPTCVRHRQSGVSSVILHSKADLYRLKCSCGWRPESQATKQEILNSLEQSQVQKTERQTNSKRKKDNTRNAIMRVKLTGRRWAQRRAGQQHTGKNKQGWGKTINNWGTRTERGSVNWDKAQGGNTQDKTGNNKLKMIKQ